jgi:hypothetical protein
MTAETEAERQQREEEFRQRMQRDGDLGLFLCEYLWRHDDDLTLGGETYEQLGCDDVPGYENDTYAVLLRRKSDGQVFDAEIDVSMHPVLRPAQVTPLCGPT